MNIAVTCISCGQKLSAPEQFAGRRVPCPKCRAPVDVPAIAAPVVPQVVPENRPRPIQPPPATPGKYPLPPGAAAAEPDLGLVDLGLGEPALPRTMARGGLSKGITVPMIAVAALLFLAAGGIGAWMLFSSKGGAGSDLRCVPDDSDIVISADVNGIISSGAGQKIKARSGDMLAALNRGMPKDSKFKPEDVGRITMGIRVQGNQGAGVIHMNRAVTDQEFPDADKALKKTVGPYQMNVNGRMAFCRIDDRTVAVGEEEVLRRILERNAPAKLSDELTAAMNEVDFSKSIAVAGSVKNLAGAAGPGGMGPMAMMPGGPGGIRGGGLQADVGDDLRLKAIVLCKDAATADQIKKMADGFLAMAKANPGQTPPEATKVVNSLDISISGSTVRASATIEVDSILSAIEPFAKQATAGAPRTMGFKPPPTAGTAPRIPGPAFNNSQPAPSPAAASGNPMAAATRMAATNNLKQIALAMISYADKENHLPASAIYNAQGTPLLSWRVAILPFLDQASQHLYTQFHLDEPWDSTNNKPLINLMPSTYRSPFGKARGFGRTAMLVPIGPPFAFFGRQGRKLTDFTDGTLQTILVVEAAPERATEWTKPDDLAISEDHPSAGLFGQREGGFLAAFADGAVKFIPTSTSQELLRALLTINGGETIPADFDGN